MNIIFLGVGIGLLSLLPPGPVNLTLVQVGARLGRQPALRGAAGIVGGDSVLGMAAVAIVAFGAAMPAQVFGAAQIFAATLLVLIGVVLLVKPEMTSASIDRIDRPGRTFFILTSLTPTALGSWIAMLAAMPFASDITQLGLFTVGVLIASFVWHPTLGVAASTLGSRLTECGQARLSRFGGVSMAALGAVLVSQQM